MALKKILVWDRRFTDRKPQRVEIEETLASVFVRAGIAAPVDGADYAALSTGAAISAAGYSDMVVWSGPQGRRVNVSLPYKVALAVIAAGAGAAINDAPPPGNALRNSTGGLITNSQGGYVLKE